MNLEKKMFDILGFSFDGKIEYLNLGYVYVKYDGRNAVISNGTPSYMTRGLTLLVKGIREGKTSFEIKEETPIKTRGIHAECSRNAVLRVSSLKKYIEIMACCGINTLFLYMEDVFRLEGYPYFGYMRGAYSKEELKEIDAYAAEFGIEVIPEIQTLGHMEQYLKWPAAAPVKGTDTVLLCGEEKTYALIEAIVSTMRECFRTDRIHVGCDEANNLHLGNYFRKNGLHNIMDVMLNHIDRVVTICKKYDFRPMLYSDMFFHECSPTGGYYHTDAVFTEEVKKKVPDAQLVYWDYGHMDEQDYLTRIEKHEELGRNIVMCTGIWGWGDLLPRYRYTFRGMIPGMKACLRKGITDVYVTTWGDEGNECNKMYELFALPLFSELCFHGESFDMEAFYSMSEFLFGIKKAFFDAVSELAEPYIPSSDYGLNDTYYGKGLFYTDLLYNLTGAVDFYREAKLRYLESAETIKGCFTNPAWKIYEDHAIHVYEILAIKADVISRLREAYENDQREYLANLVQEILPDLLERYQCTLISWQKMWLSTCKPFGWEVINGRLGFVIARLEYAKQQLAAYLEGEIASIEELEEPYLENKALARTPRFINMVTTSCTV